MSPISKNEKKFIFEYFVFEWKFTFEYAIISFIIKLFLRSFIIATHKLAKYLIKKMVAHLMNL